MAIFRGWLYLPSRLLTAIAVRGISDRNDAILRALALAPTVSYAEYINSKIQFSRTGIRFYERGFD